MHIETIFEGEKCDAAQLMGYGLCHTNGRSALKRTKYESARL